MENNRTLTNKAPHLGKQQNTYKQNTIVKQLSCLMNQHVCMYVCVLIILITTDRYTQAGSHGDGSLMIASVTVGDSSVIFCRASNLAQVVNTDAIQLKVIESPILASSILPSYTPAEGSEVILTCTVSPSTLYSTVQYQWSRENIIIQGPSNNGKSCDAHVTLLIPPTGTLVIPSLTTSNNGEYVCHVIISVSGVAGSLLTHQLGATVISVGDPPTAPSKPLNPFSTSVTSTSFTAHWTTPTTNGGLPLRNYTIEVESTGRTLCTGSFDWEPLITGTDPLATSAVVGSLIPAFTYRFRITTFNFLFQSPSSDIVTVTTLESGM